MPEGGPTGKEIRGRVDHCTESCRAEGLSRHLVQGNTPETQELVAELCSRHKMVLEASGNVSSSG